MDEARFSVIIPSYNEAGQIGQTITAVKAAATGLTLSEIIVVDNCSTDRTVEIARGLGIKVIENTLGKRMAIAALRNTGAGCATGNILAFLDADMLVPANWLASAREYFCSGFVGALGFISVVPDSAGWVGRTWGNQFQFHRGTVKEVDFLPGRNILINRHVFDKIGGFNENLRTNEDKDLTYRVCRAGYKVMSLPEPSVLHLGFERNLIEFLRKEFWRQGNTIRFARLHNFSARTLRNPALASWHLFFLFFTITALFSADLPLIIVLISCWGLPSLLITWGKTGPHGLSGFFLPFFFLTLLRWNVAGFALVYQLFKGSPSG